MESSEKMQINSCACASRIAKSRQSFDHFNSLLHLDTPFERYDVMAHCLSMQFVAAYRLRGRQRFILFIISCQNVFQLFERINSILWSASLRKQTVEKLIIIIVYLKLQSFLLFFNRVFRLPHTLYCVPEPEQYSHPLAVRSITRRATGGISYSVRACNSIRIKLLEGYTCSQSLGNDIVHWRCRCVWT